MIHGEYYPHNILFQSGVVRPVDWETAALAPGEIDLATLCEGWPPEEIRLTMEKQMTAERTRRAVVTTAEGEKASAIIRAEGQKQSQIVTAEGSKEAAILAAEGQAQAQLRVAEAQAKAIQVVAEAIGGSGNPAQYLIAQRYMESLTAIANGADKIVFMPYEATGVLSSLGGIKELLGEG